MSTLGSSFHTRHRRRLAVSAVVIVALAMTGVGLVRAGSGGADRDRVQPQPSSVSSASRAASAGAAALTSTITVAPWVPSSIHLRRSLPVVQRIAVASVMSDKQNTSVVDAVRLTSWGSRWLTVDVDITRDAGAQPERLVLTMRRDARWHVIATDPGLTSAAPAAFGAFAASPPVPPDVGGDQGLGAIVGTGSLLLPGNFDGDPSVRQDAAQCPDCEWRKRVNCRGGGPDLCVGALVGCQPMQVRYQILLRRPPATEFSVVGLICLGPGEQLRTTDQLAADVRDRFVDLVPRASPSYQPADGALVNLPALFAANEPASIGPEEFTLAGYRIVVTAQAEWTWAFGDGTSLVTDRPGGRYPDRSVRHTFSTPGERRVDLVSTWAGEFTVDGMGPYPVAGAPITLTTTLPVTAREAGARLLSND